MGNLGKTNFDSHANSHNALTEQGKKVLHFSYAFTSLNKRV